jgi:hypothetical protein
LNVHPGRIPEALSEKKAVDLKDEPSLGVTSTPQEGPETYKSCQLVVS